MISASKLTESTAIDATLVATPGTNSYPKISPAATLTALLVSSNMPVTPEPIVTLSAVSAEFFLTFSVESPVMALALILT